MIAYLTFLWEPSDNSLFSSPADFRSSTPIFYAVIDADPYVLPLIHSALSAIFSTRSYEVIVSPKQLPSTINNLLQITPYERLDFDHILEHPKTTLANSYIIRKALIRKVSIFDLHYIFSSQIES